MLCKIILFLTYAVFLTPARGEEGLKFPDFSASEARVFETKQSLEIQFDESFRNYFGIAGVAQETGDLRLCVSSLGLSETVSVKRVYSVLGMSCQYPKLKVTLKDSQSDMARFFGSTEFYLNFQCKRSTVELSYESLLYHLYFDMGLPSLGVKDIVLTSPLSNEGKALQGIVVESATTVGLRHDPSAQLVEGKATTVRGSYASWFLFKVQELLFSKRSDRQMHFNSDFTRVSTSNVFYVDVTDGAGFALLFDLDPPFWWLDLDDQLQDKTQKLFATDSADKLQVHCRVAEKLLAKPLSWTADSPVLLRTDDPNFRQKFLLSMADFYSGVRKFAAEGC